MLLICLSSLALYVHAEEKSATFTTDVPENNSIHLTLKGPGPILVNGNPYNNGAVINVDDHGNAVVELPPDSNLRIVKITVNGEDVTDKIVNNVLEIKDITDDIELYVEVAKPEKEETPVPEDKTSTSTKISQVLPTGDTTNLVTYIIVLAASALVIAVVMIVEKKK